MLRAAGAVLLLGAVAVSMVAAQCQSLDDAAAGAELRITFSRQLVWSPAFTLTAVDPATGAGLGGPWTWWTQCPRWSERSMWLGSAAGSRGFFAASFGLALYADVMAQFGATTVTDCSGAQLGTVSESGYSRDAVRGGGGGKMCCRLFVRRTRSLRPCA
jgi:hypothetical protein